MLLKKLSKARTGVLVSERVESIGRIEVCRFIIRSSKLPFFLTKPFMQREQKMGRRTRMWEKIVFGVVRRSAPPLRFLIAWAGSCAFMCISIRSLLSVQ